MEYLEDRTAHGNIDSLFYGISLRGEYVVLMVYSVGSESRFSKGYKYVNFPAPWVATTVAWPVPAPVARGPHGPPNHCY